MEASRNFQFRIINENIGYFQFFEEANAKDFKEAFKDFIRMAKDPVIDRFIVALDQKSKWDSAIEKLWLRTAEMAEQYKIKKWGIVTPYSPIRSTNLNRVVKKDLFYENPSYDFYIAENEEVVLEWIKV